MTAPHSAIISLPSPQATTLFAQSIAPHLHPGDTILLRGELGSGKTHFDRALIQARLSRGDRSEDIPSPTYTLVQTYFDGICDIWHADLYRLTDAQEVVELGLPEAMQDCICLIEWPDILGAERPANALDMELLQHDGPNARRAEISWDVARWDPLLHILAQYNV